MKKALIIILSILIVILLFLFFRTNQFYSKIYTAKSEGITPITKEQTTFNILLLGYGGGLHAGTYLTDTMMLVNINIKSKRVVLVSIPRDLWVKIPTSTKESFHAKINSVYQMGLFPKRYPNLPAKYYGQQGAAELTKLIVSVISGQNIDYYIAVDFSGFKKAVDLLGGVDIDVKQSFDDYKYPIEGKENDPCELEGDELEKALTIATEEPELAFPCRYEHLRFDSGYIHMDGETSLKYVRSRYSQQNGGDFARAGRQQLFLEALKDKMLSLGIIPKILPLMNELEDNIRTDIPIELIHKFTKEADSSAKYTSSQLVLSTDNFLQHSTSIDRQYILISKEGQDFWKGVRKGIRSKIASTSASIEKIGN